MITRLRALVVLPTRDLVAQVRETVEMLSRGTGLKVICFMFSCVVSSDVPFGSYGWDGSASVYLPHIFGLNC